MIKIYFISQKYHAFEPCTTHTFPASFNCARLAFEGYNICAKIKSAIDFLIGDIMLFMLCIAIYVISD